MLRLEKYSIGVGDRFGRQARAQLRACEQIRADGVSVAPVWNKSNREHTLIGSEPASVRAAAAAAVAEAGWTGGWHVDADHIRLETVDRFLPSSDFFTIDVADFIGLPASPESLAAFVARHPELAAPAVIAGLEGSTAGDLGTLHRVAAKYLYAVQEAGRIYRHIARQKTPEGFVAEVSMDETDTPQTPVELLIILAAIADEGLAIQTIAPKFTGRFNKGVDYQGDLARFEKEFNDDLAVIAHAVNRYGLPANLKLSVHSGSDKFSLYPIIGRALRRFGAGLHLKTAGTSWLEEIIGLAEAGGAALELAQEIYAEAVEHSEELCRPYATVIDIDPARLPAAADVARWTETQFANALRHEPGSSQFNASFRQLLHVSFKLAGRRGQAYLDLLDTHRVHVGRNVTDNLYRKHLRPLFAGLA